MGCPFAKVSETLSRSRGEPREAPGGGPFPVRVFFVVLSATGIFVAVVAWGLAGFYRYNKTSQERAHRETELRGTILYLDEVLTMSARVAAATGDLRWEKRYRRFGPKLNAAIEEAMQIAPGLKEGKDAPETNLGKRKLVEMENNAFRLIRRGRREEAQKVLFSEAYAIQRGIYADGLRRLTALLDRRVHTVFHAERGQALGLFGFFAVAFLGMMFAWVGLFRKLKRWHQELLEGQWRQSDRALKESEERCRAVIETASDAFVTMDISGRIIEWNRQAEIAFGWARAEAVGQVLADLIIPPEARAAHTKGVEHFRATREGPILNKRIEVSALHREGYEFPVELTVWPVQTGGSLTLSAFLRDISGRRLAEDRFRGLLESIPDALVVTDGQGRIVIVNAQAEKLFGYDKASLIGQPIEMLMPERFREKHAHHREDWMVNLPPRAMGIGLELFALHHDGREISVEISLSSLKSDEGILIISAIRDITDRKKLERIAVQAEKMAAVGQLAGGVAHEINNPLGIILGFSQMVAKQVKEENPLAKPVKIMEREAIRCKNLVQDLLLFSRSSKSGQLEEVDINATVEASLSLIRARGKTAEVEIVREFDPQLPPVRGNKNQIQQVVINLANNAIDATPRGGKVILRTRSSVTNSDSVVIEVRDTGSGISKEIQAKIFEPFFTTKEVGKGTGLGLSLVHEIVEKHHGMIQLDSQVGEGTAFTVFLPRAKEA